MRLACFSDIHGNHHALSKLLKIIEKQSIDRVIFLGDAIGYFPSIACLNILNSHDFICIRGNHDSVILTKILSEKLEHIYKHSTVLAKIQSRHEDQVKKWVEFYKYENYIFFHGGPTNFQNQYIYPDTDLTDVYKDVKNIDTSLNICVSGHTHHAFIREFKDMTFINVGSAGLPRDYGIFASFTIIDTLTNEFTIHRFNIEDELKMMIYEYPETHESVINLLQRNSMIIPKDLIE